MLFSKAGAALVQRHISFKVNRETLQIEGRIKRPSLTALLLYAISSWKQNEFILTTVICFIIYCYSQQSIYSATHKL